RRLAFVGITRAKERLFLTRTFIRDTRGSRMLATPSRFLSEMPLATSGAGDGFDFGQPESATGNPVGPLDERRDEEPGTNGLKPQSSVPRPIGIAPGGPEARPRRGGFPHLTTGADLLNGTATAVDISQP